MTFSGISEAFLKSAICGMTEVVRTNQGYEVSLPQAYASGNVVAVVVAEESGGYLVHDNAYAAMVLERTGASKTTALAAEMATAVSHYGCELDQMRVVRRCSSIGDVALSAILVGCASRLIADQSIKVDALPLYNFKSKLLGKVTAVVGAKRVRTKYPVVGHLGSNYKVSAAVLDDSANDPLAFVEPISDQSAVARKFKEFYDLSLNDAYSGIERVSVIDDEAGNVPTGDALLLQEVSTLVRYSDTSKLFRQWSTAS